MHAIPLSGQDEHLLGILLVGNTRRPYVELRNRIRSAALLAGSVGIFLAILFSGWAASRVTRPVEQLAGAAREVAAGNWNTRVPVNSADELGALADSFNRMTHELLQQREQLVQSERVAAWRELARRLAHELKNPLFPLQLTVENLVRAREQSPEQFDEVFRESSSTLLAEIANLKANHFAIQRIFAHAATAISAGSTERDRAECGAAPAGSIALEGEPGDRMQSRTGAGSGAGCGGCGAAAPGVFQSCAECAGCHASGRHADPAHSTGSGSRSIVEIADTGTGLTAEECERLFTPYYTSKAHGTGLGLAIVQSVISDHGGRISVHSEPGHGTTFTIELPRNWEKLEAG